MGRPRLRNLLYALLAVLLLGCRGPLYHYRTVDTVYIVSPVPEGDGTPLEEQIALPSDHSIDLVFTGGTKVETAAGDRLRLLFDVRVANSSPAAIEIEGDGIRLLDAGGTAWQLSHLADQAPGEFGMTIGPGAERLFNVAFDLPEGFDYAMQPSLIVVLPYRLGEATHRCEIRMARERLPEPVYFRGPPPPGYYGPDPYYYGPPVHVQFFGVFHH